ncbi:YhjD/YihY/BrkB family envelope integrity protein [Kitasatospora sp. NPDC052868]|uniref:YhjD/YihY/BrkB family envelope integrity protein n=1 Tax=Kitasatospora sp. NPDC052868 TaxID=3364060 RepID=UPI0037C7155B
MTAQTSRERVIRTLTFWLRPAFALRCFSRFQRLVGFDRSMALAAGALAATVPLSILVGSILTHTGHQDAADRIINRYQLTGEGAEAVREVLSLSSDTSTTVGIFGAVFLVISVLSFARAVQRLFEQTWELRPLSVRNTLNDLLWVAGLAGYGTVTGLVYGFLGHGRLGVAAAAVEAPVTAAFLVWSGWILTARRIAWRALIPFGAVGGVLVAVYSVGATVYLPHLFSSSATRYGAVGAVFATLSALFGVMVVIVGSAALGREVREELVGIARGERPPDDEIRREWHTVIDQARSRWHSTRQQIARYRRPKEPDGP